MTGPSGAERTLVVGVDASDSARHAALWAVDLAAARGCGVELVHVVAGRPRTVPHWLTEIADSADRAGAVPWGVDVVTGAVTALTFLWSVNAVPIEAGQQGEKRRTPMPRDARRRTSTSTTRRCWDIWPRARATYSSV